MARTLVDLAGLLSPGATEYAIHQAQIRRRFDRAEMLDVLERSPTRAGTALIRRIIDTQTKPDLDVRSGPERRFLAICRRACLALPHVNFWIALQAGGGFEVDFAWPDRQLLVEIDSRTFHDTYRAFENDPRRDRLLMLAGWRVVRFTDRDVTERPAAVGAELKRLLSL